MSKHNFFKMIAGPVHSLPKKYWLGAAVLWILAAVLHWGAAPYYEKMPADYSMETRYTAKLWSRQTPASDATETDSVVRRHDQTLSSSESHSIIQGDAHWLTAAGAPIFETLNIYGIDRRTRQNLPGYGDRERTGQYLFPPHTLKQPYGFWDPLYAGPNFVSFAHVDQLRDVEVYVFDSKTDGLDETAGYEALPDVPEKYRAVTYGNGRFWVEPVSGIVIDHEDRGTSFFVDPDTGQHVGEPMNRWSQRFTPETIDSQLRLAISARRRMLALERWLPFAFAVAGTVLITGGFRARRTTSS